MEFLEEQNFDTTMKQKDYLLEYFSICVRFSSELLMEEIKPAVRDKNGLEYRVFPEPLHVFLHFQSFRIAWHEKKSMHFHKNTFLQA